jgi:hypothetical protein
MEETYAMEQGFAFQYFAFVLVAAILLAGFIGTYFVAKPSVVLTFYYFPVLVAAHFLGGRIGLLTAVLSILLVLVCSMVLPTKIL